MGRQRTQGRTERVFPDGRGSMKNKSRIIAAAITVMLLLGACGAPAPSGGEAAAQTALPIPAGDDTAPQTPQFVLSVDRDAEQTALPVLSIETARRDPGATDFVTEPVAAHVAREIASWTPGYVMPPAPYYEDCAVCLRSGEGEALLGPCEAQVKVRGNWTTIYPKKPLRIRFSEKQSLLGLNGGAEQKNWLLLAEYKDASMLRDKAALFLSRAILAPDGLYASDAAFVRVELNGEYLGLYLLAEMQQVSACRVRITEPEEGYGGTDIGYFLEYDGYFSDEDALQSFPLDFADNAPLRAYTGDPNSREKMRPLPAAKRDVKKPVGVTVKSNIYSQEQHDFIENFVNKTYRIMYEAAYNDKAFVFDEAYRDIVQTDALTPREAVERVVDLPSLADMYIISELTCDADIYWSSFFMDVDFGPGGSRKLRFEAPWDFDSSMGNKDRCLSGVGFYACNIVPDVNGGPDGGGQYETINPWLAVLAYEDWYQELVRETWKRAYDSGVFVRCCEMIADDSARLRDEFEANYAKWDNIRSREAFEAELSEPAKNCRTQAEAAEFLLQWMSSRVAFLNSQWNT